MTKITQSQFSDAQDKLDAEMRASKPGTPERVLAEERNAKWEAAIALPDVKWVDREARLVAIARVATELGLV